MVTNLSTRLMICSRARLPMMYLAACLPYAVRTADFMLPEVS